VLTKPVRLQHIEAALEAVGLVLNARSSTFSSLGSPSSAPSPSPTLGMPGAGAGAGAALGSPGFAAASFAAKASPT